MPLPTEGLTKDSTSEQIREYISQAIEQCMAEGGGDQKQCASIAYETARKSTGKDLDLGN
jgi:hypothetical protein